VSPLQTVIIITTFLPQLPSFQPPFWMYMYVTFILTPYELQFTPPGLGGGWVDELSVENNNVLDYFVPNSNCGLNLYACVNNSLMGGSETVPDKKLYHNNKNKQQIQNRKDLLWFLYSI
jgi:hypothetical protein